MKFPKGPADEPHSLWGVTAPLSVGGPCLKLCKKHKRLTVKVDWVFQDNRSSCSFPVVGRSVAVSSSHTAAADIQLRPVPHKEFMVPRDTVPSLLLVWDFCQRYG